MQRIKGIGQRHDAALVLDKCMCRFFVFRSCIRNKGKSLLLIQQLLLSEQQGNLVVPSNNAAT